MIKRTTIVETIVVLNVILFLYTGISKMMEYSEFKEQLWESPILRFASTPIALLLPWMEFAIVLLLIIPKWRLKGLYATFILMILFTVYIIALFSINIEMPCSCGGIIALLSWKQHLVFNGAYILINFLAIELLRKERKEQQKGWAETNKYLLSRS